MRQQPAKNPITAACCPPWGVLKVPGVLFASAIVPALKNYYMQSFLEVPTGVLNHFWIQVTISLLKPPHGGFRSETAVT